MNKKSAPGFGCAFMLQIDWLHDRQKEHFIRVVKPEAVIGHRIAAVGGFHLIAGKFLSAGDDVHQREGIAVCAGKIAQRAEGVSSFARQKQRFAESGIRKRAFAHGDQDIVHGLFLPVKAAAGDKVLFSVAGKDGEGKGVPVAGDGECEGVLIADFLFILLAMYFRLLLVSKLSDIIFESQLVKIEGTSLTTCEIVTEVRSCC